jgi:hypothetical protein
VEEGGDDHASGSFSRRGNTIRFALSRDDAGNHARISNASGEPILETTLSGAFDSSVYFGGKASARGTVGAEIQDKTGVAASLPRARFCSDRRDRGRAVA